MGNKHSLTTPVDFSWDSFPEQPLYQSINLPLCLFGFAPYNKVQWAPQTGSLSFPENDHHYGLKLYNAAFYRDLQPINARFGQQPPGPAIESDQHLAGFDKAPILGELGDAADLQKLPDLLNNPTPRYVAAAYQFYPAWTDDEVKKTMHPFLSEQHITDHSIYQYDPTLSMADVANHRKALLTVEGAAEAVVGKDEVKEKFFEKYKIWPGADGNNAPAFSAGYYTYAFTFNDQLDDSLKITEHHWQTKFFRPNFELMRTDFATRLATPQQRACRQEVAAALYPGKPINAYEYQFIHSTHRPKSPHYPITPLLLRPTARDPRAFSVGLTVLTPKSTDHTIYTEQDMPWLSNPIHWPLTLGKVASPHLPSTIPHSTPFVVVLVDIYDPRS